MSDQRQGRGSGRGDDRDMWRGHRSDMHGAGPSSRTPYSRPQSGRGQHHPSVKGIVKTIGGQRDDRGGGGGGDFRGGENIIFAQNPNAPGFGSRTTVERERLTSGRGANRNRRPIPSEVVPTKPKTFINKRGCSGETVILRSNYFKLMSMADWSLYQYRVDFDPPEERTVIRKGLLKLHKNKLGAYIFDGTILYTAVRLHQTEADCMTLMSQRQSDSVTITIAIRLVGDMMKGDHHYLQFFNIIMRKCLDSLKLQLVGRNYFDARAKVKVPEYRLELWPGYLTSIRQHEHDILMCAEITHKVMRQQTLLDILSECYHMYGHDYQKQFLTQVTGLVVLTDYNNNTYRIDDVDFGVTPDSSFTLKNGESISYKDYYKNKYNIRICNVTQPMLVTRTKPKDRRAGQAELVYLVPELCRATGLTDQMRGNFHLMRELAKHTRVSPESRIAKLMAFNRRLRSEENVMQELQEWQLKLDESLVEVPGRVLPTEKILFNGIQISAGFQADWTRNLREAQLLITKGLQDWVVVCSDRVKRDTQSFLNMLTKAAGGMRFQIGQPRIFDVRDDRSNSYTDTIERIMSKSMPELIFCVVPNNRADRYSAIKKKCLVDRPVPTQVFLQKNLNAKGVMSIATKVAIQLNCKLGGAPWSVEVPLGALMVVGFDVCHDTNNKGQDFGAMVASLDRNLTRYFSAVSAHTNGEELSNNLSTNLIRALHKYREINGMLPKQILIYRDGVGEGQVPYVHDHEVTHLRRKLEALYEDSAKVKMAFILVTKRINTRFFSTSGNPAPGTVVDDVVTNPIKYDFFIISQHVGQGTVSPTAYSVINDTVGLDADKIQRMTYKLTHIYYNWSGTVRVPAPCQYAHKLAFLVSQFIHRPPSSDMESLLYFL